MGLWDKAAEFDKDTPKTELGLALQGLILELNSENEPSPSQHEVKGGLLRTITLCGDETKLKVKWCQLAVLALNSTQCIFSTRELNECTSFILDVCRETNNLYCTVEALGALLYNVDMNLLKLLDKLLGERGVVLELSLGCAPEREVQHLALRCLNNMLNSVTDEMFLTHIVSTLTSLATARLHGDNLNRARLLAGAMKCLQTITKHNPPQYVLEQVLSVVKGFILEGVSLTSSPAISLESLSLDELNLSDVSEPGQARYSQPRVRNKKGRGKRRKADIGKQEHQPFRAGKDAHRGSPQSEVHQQSSSWRVEQKQVPSRSTAQSSKPPSKRELQTQEPGQPLNKNMGFDPHHQPDFSVSTSESEYSESDTEEGLANKVQAVNCRARLTTFQTLQQCISSVHKSRTYGIWSAFLPTDPSLGLLHVIGQEHHVKSRIAGLAALTSLIESAKHYFVAADSRPGGGKAPYTPFSQTLATDIHTLHTTLISQISDCPASVLPHLFQCLAVLVIHTPFSKLRPGLVSKILDSATRHISFPPHFKVESGALALLCACLTVETPLSEVGEWLLSHHNLGDVTFCNDVTLRSSHNETLLASQCEAALLIPQLEMMLGKCLEHLNLAAHQRDILQIICQILRFYFPSVVHWWPDIVNTAKYTLTSSTDTLIHNMSLLVMEELGRALAAALDRGVVELMSLREHWILLLSGVIVPILQDEHSTVMPGACDILSTIGNTVFSSFEVHTQRLIMTLLLALTNPTVAATSSACRCLGVLVMYPCIRDDLLFVADTANAIITAMESTDSADSGLLLRVSWSLGNLSDTLVVNKLNNPTFVSDFSDLLLGRLLDVSLKSANANDKVKSNIVRALGNLLRFMKQSTYDKVHFKEYVTKSVECLLKCCTSGMMKTRWNACYALVNTLQNPVLSPATTTWGTNLFDTLTSVISHCKNFKVRINATLALSQCAARACYGASFHKVWSTVLITLSGEGGSGGGGGAMCGYTDKLKLQLILLLCHMTVLHQSKDRDQMNASFPPPHLRASLVSQCSMASTADTLSDPDKDLISRARLVCEQAGKHLQLVHSLLVPPQLPSDTEAFLTSDISQNRFAALLR